MTNHSQAAPITPLIDGRSVSSVNGDALDLINPATGAVAGACPAGDARDVDQAVASARAAFEAGRWRGLSLSARRDVLLAWAGLIEQHADELNRLDAIDMGKPVSSSAFNAAGAAGLIRDEAYGAERLCGNVYQSDEGCFASQAHLPRGVVAAVTPWNFPTFNAVMKVSPALATGNCVVLKPSELSPSSAQRVVHLAHEAGLPPGVLNFVPGRGDITGKALALHHDVDMIAFTGSTAVGGLMLQYAGQSNLKVVHAECGGKSPQIVFPDAEDLDVVADHVAGSLLLNQGQVCSAGTRLIVHEAIEEALIEKLAERFGAIVPGDPLDPATTYGPLVSMRQMEKVLSYIETGAREGADLVAGGGRLLEETGGYYMTPTLFRNVDPQATIAQEEIFGPVLSVTTFSDVDDAIRLANATRYGLIATAWTRDMTIGLRLSKEVRAGMVFVNAKPPQGQAAGAVSIEPQGQSGTGVEMGTQGLKAYTKRQTAIVNYG